MYENKHIEDPIGAEEVRSIIGRTEEIQSNPNKYEDPVEVKIGIVTDCVRLNVRKEPQADAEIVCEVDSQSELMIDENQSSDEFYKVCTASGVEGFCVQKYIEIQQ